MAPTKRELILAIGVMLAIPVAGEIVLRLAEVQFDAQLYMPDRERGWRLRPGASGVVSVETKQYVRINSHGFRDGERAYEKPADTVRIAVLGNSWTEALQVPLEKTYCSVLERALTEGSCFPGNRVEVLNFGVAGYSTAQELLTLQQEVWKYHPDIVVVAFYPARDIANNLRELNNASNPERSPYFVYREGKLSFDDSFRTQPALQPQQIRLQDLRYELSERSRVLQGIGALQRFAKARLATAAVRERAEKAGFDNLEYSFYKPPSRADMQNAWRVTEGLLLAIRDEAKAHGAEFRIVTLATRPQVLPDAAERAKLMRKLGVENLSYADDRIREFGVREGIAVTNLASALSRHAEEQHVYLNGFTKENQGAGHWNETGHRLAGEAIAGDLCAAKQGNGDAMKTVAAAP